VREYATVKKVDEIKHRQTEQSNGCADIFLPPSRKQASRDAEWEEKKKDPFFGTNMAWVEAFADGEEQNNAKTGDA
jgi:hypothetical protein